MIFNKAQLGAIEHKDGAMIVLAGPGSGKTAVITHRTKNLITKHHVKPSEILVITFTKAAANEMKERFNSLMKDERVNVSFGTFHAVFFTILKYAYRFTSANIADESVRYGFIREILSYYRLEYKDENEFIGNLLAEISLIKNSRIDIENFYSGVCGEEIFRDIYKKYETRLKENRLIDFDDMLSYTYELFKERPDILALWQNKYKYILIDEFQDINRLQYEIIKMLAAPQNNLFIVGDDDQSIYRFRGSKPEIMLGFEKDYPGAKRILLDTNYRCGRYIVEASLNLISHNRERFDKKIIAASKSKAPVTFADFENRRDENIFLIRDIDKKIKAGAVFSDFAVLFRTNTQPRQLIEQLMSYNIPFKTKDNIPNIYEHWIARDLFTYQRIAGGSRDRADFENRRDENIFLIRDIDKKIKAGAVFSDFAVLFRTNTQPRQLIEQLMSYNIPFKTKDNIPNIYEHWIARDLFTYQRIAGGSRDRADFLQIMNRPKRYLSRDSLCDATVAFDEWIKLFDEKPWIAERIEKLEYDMKLISRMNPYASINYIRRGIGYDDFLAEYAEYRNINKEDLFDILDEIQSGAKGFATYEEWYEHIREYTKQMKLMALSKESDPNAVTLATLHSSKGLEFENVYIIDANEGIMPYKKAVLEKDVEEERRLFYVGMTRAKTSLSVYSVKSVNDKSAQASRFVRESKEPRQNNSRDD